MMNASPPKVFGPLASVLMVGCGAIVADATGPVVADSTAPDAARDAGDDTGVADAIADTDVGAEGLVTTCGGKVCHGICAPTPDLCTCYGIVGGCPPPLVCCPFRPGCHSKCL